MNNLHLQRCTGRHQMEKTKRSDLPGREKKPDFPLKHRRVPTGEGEPGPDFYLQSFQSGGGDHALGLEIFVFVVPMEKSGSPPRPPAKRFKVT